MIQKKNIHSDSHHYAEKKKICRLQDEQCLVIDEAGGKAVNLAKLRRAGFPVPDGVVVTTTAFAEYMLDIPDGDSAVIRGTIMERPLDERLQQELREAITPFGDVPFAVRSSGVAEDLADASFAGQYDTLLGVHGFDAVESAVRTCFASAFSRHILQYRAVKQAMAGRMAVLIQPIIEADAAGVAFTANPVTGDRKEVLVSAVKGLGERLVSGQAPPDEWTVRGQQAVPIQLPERAMEADDILRVAHLARKAALHFGQPQDIEWAISRGELYLLQARPITTLPRDNTGAKRQIPLPVEVPEGFWEREVSHYPDVLAPATRSTFIVAMNHAMRNLCTEMSLMIETLEQKEIGGWLYQRVVPLGGKERKAPPAWLMPILIRLVPQIKSRLAGAVAWVREDRAGKLLRDWEVRLKPELTRKASNLALVQLDDFSDDQLAAYLSESFEFLKYCLDQHMLLNGAIEYMIARFVFECRALLDWDEAQSMQAFGGLSEISSAPGRAIEAMANFVQSHPALLHDLQEGCSLRDLEASHPKFAEKVAAYVREFGLRALRAELNYPTVGESSHILLQLLKDQLSGNTGQVAEHASILAQQRQRRLAETEQRLRGRTEVERVRFSLLLDNAKRAYPLREEHGFYDRDVPVGLLRYGFLEAGKRFVARGHLDCIDDVFDLEFDEVVRALVDSASVRHIVEKRQGERNWAIANPGPASYGPVPSPPPSFASFPKEARFLAEGVTWALEQIFATEQSGRVQRDASRIEGISASTGEYTGKVRVIREESEFSKIQPGDILVCPITSPVWSMVFPNIGALVTDSGGILSHSAIIAREYRIPAVVATGNATSLLTDGQVVTVNGDRGLVELARAEQAY